MTLTKDQIETIICEDVTLDAGGVVDAGPAAEKIFAAISPPVFITGWDIAGSYTPPEKVFVNGLTYVPETTGSEADDRDLCVPGLWYCAKCQFTLLQSNLNSADGTVTARDEPGDKCPNDGAPLWRVTWKQHAGEMALRCEEALARAQAAEKQLPEMGRQPIAEIVSAHGDPEAFGERELVALTDIQKFPYGTKLFAVRPLGSEGP